MMKYFWIDPPEGYIWGFPRVVCVEELNECTDWDEILIAHGYPADKRDTLPMRMWEASEEDVLQAAVTTLNKTN